MSVIAATASSSSYSAVAQLLTDGLSNAAAAATQSGQAAGSAADTSSGNPTDTVDLSDRAKAVLAQAQKDQVLADQLQQLVQSNRSGAGKSSTSDQSPPSASTSGQAADTVIQAFDRLTGQTDVASASQQTDGSNGEAS